MGAPVRRQGARRSDVKSKLVSPCTHVCGNMDGGTGWAQHGGSRAATVRSYTLHSTPVLCIPYTSM